MLDETLLETLWTPDQAEFLDRVQAATPVDAAVAAVADARRWHAMRTAAVTAAYVPHRLGKGKVGGGRFAKKGDIGIDILRDLLRGKGTARTAMHAEFGKRMRDPKSDFGRGDITPANINKWATVAFGPRPNVAADAQAWDRGRSELAGYLSAIPARSRMPRTPDVPDVPGPGAPNIGGDRNDMAAVLSSTRLRDRGGNDIGSLADRLPAELHREITAGDGSKENPFQTADPLTAVHLLAADQHVALAAHDRNQVTVVLAEAKKMADELKAAAKAEGGEAPVLDLCKLHVPRSNLFCEQSKGIPRVEMPQLSGTPLPGSPADAMPKNEEGKVDLTDGFPDYLAKHGIKVTAGRRKVSTMKATQSEMDAGKSGGIMRGWMDVRNRGITRIDDGPPNAEGRPQPRFQTADGEIIDGGEADRLAGLTAPLFVDRDGYIVDGHHRWAGAMGADLEYGDDLDLEMDVLEIDPSVDIIEVLALANQYTAEMGIPQAAVGKETGDAVPNAPDAPGTAPGGDTNDMAGAPADAASWADGPDGAKTLDLGDGYAVRVTRRDGEMDDVALTLDGNDFGGDLSSVVRRTTRADGAPDSLAEAEAKGRRWKEYRTKQVADARAKDPKWAAQWDADNASPEAKAAAEARRAESINRDLDASEIEADADPARAAKPPVTLPDPLPATAVTHPDGTVWDTVDNFGMKYDPANVDNPHVAAARAAESAFDGVPLTTIKLDGTGPVLNANEAEVKLSTIERVKQTGLRPGYDPKVIIDPDGNYHIVDGHHRVAIHSAMGKDMQAQVIDLRENPTAFDTPDAATPGNVEIVTPDERAGLVERHGEEYVAKAEEAARALLAKIEKMDAPVTGSLTDIASEIGMEMVSLDTRRKTEASLTRKLADKSVAKGLTLDEYAPQVADALRYTATSPAENHAEHVAAFVQKLRDRGYRIDDAEIENYWAGAADDYNGINATFHVLGPDGEPMPVELQFHTPETLAAKDEAHVWYEKGRVSTDPQVKIEAFNESMRIFESVPRPPGIENVGTPMAHTAPAAPPAPDAPRPPTGSPFPSPTPGQPLSVPPGSATFDSNDMGATAAKVEPIPNIPADGMPFDDAEEAVNERLRSAGIDPSKLDISYPERPGFGGTEAIVRAPDTETADGIEDVLKGTGLDYTRRGNVLSYDGYPAPAARTEVPGQEDLFTGKPIEQRTATDLLDGDTSPDHIREVLRRGDLTDAQREELRRLLPAAPAAAAATEAVAAALAVAERAAARRRDAAVAAALQLAQRRNNPVH